jgi:hypothetical protein
MLFCPKIKIDVTKFPIGLNHESFFVTTMFGKGGILVSKEMAKHCTCDGLIFTHKFI